jgi:hypothetical protein
MPYRLDPNTGQFVWDGSSIPQTTRDSLGTQIRELQAQIDALSFVDLDDAPTTYTGQSGKILSVKSSEDGLEFVANSSGGTVTSVSGTAPISVANGTTTPSITIATFGTSAAGVVPASGGGTTNFLRADGSWQAPPGGAGVSDGDKGDVIVSSSGTVWALDTSGVTAGSYTLASVTIDAKGRITAASNGTAAAGTKSLPPFLPINSQPPAANFATRDTTNSTSPVDVLDFDPVTNEFAVWTGLIPEGFNLTGGLKAEITWKLDTATPSGDVVWAAQIERMTTDLRSDSWDSAHTASGTANGTAGITTTTEITLTNIDGVMAGEPFRIRIYRDAAAAGDTAAFDAELILLEIRGN